MRNREPCSCTFTTSKNAFTLSENHTKQKDDHFLEIPQNPTGKYFMIHKICFTGFLLSSQNQHNDKTAIDMISIDSTTFNSSQRLECNGKL